MIATTVKVTSQGQVSIPAKVRDKLKIKPLSTFFITTTKDGKIIFEPVKDILELRGIFSDRAIKNKSINEVIELEEKAAEEYVIEKFSKKYN